MTNNTSNHPYIAASLFRAAVNDARNSEKRASSAEQRAAAAIIAAYGEWIESDAKPAQVPSLSAVLQPGEAGKTFRNYCALKLIAPKQMTELRTYEQKALEKRRCHAEKQIITRAFGVLVVLDACGLTLASYDNETGVFQVPASMLMPQHATPRGIVASKLVKLDRHPIAWEQINSEGTPERDGVLQASVAQLKKAYDERIGKATKVGRTTGSTSEGNGKAGAAPGALETGNTPLDADGYATLVFRSAKNTKVALQELVRIMNEDDKSLTPGVMIDLNKEGWRELVSIAETVNAIVRAGKAGAVDEAKAA